MFDVLIVEDEDLIRKGLAYTFNWLDYDCVVVGEACNGKEAIAMIDEKQPDIVLTDIRMPIMDGLEMIASYEVRNFETVIITGHAEFEYAKKAIKYDVTDFMLKPLDHDELGKVIEKLVDKIRKKRLVALVSERIRNISELEILDEVYYFQSSNQGSWHVSKVLKFIQDHYSERLSLDFIAEELEVSGTYLSRKFKKETQHTFNEFLTKYRLQKALELIQEGHIRIYEIAEKVGFSEYKYFSKVFKKYFDHSPTDFMQMELYTKSEGLREPR